jgi:hypothetical protein
LRGLFRALCAADDEPAAADPAAALLLRRDLAVLDADQQGLVLGLFERVKSIDPAADPADRRVDGGSDDRLLRWLHEPDRELDQHELVRRKLGFTLLLLELPEAVARKCVSAAFAVGCGQPEAGFEPFRPLGERASEPLKGMSNQLKLNRSASEEWVTLERPHPPFTSPLREFPSRVAHRARAMTSFMISLVPPESRKLSTSSSLHERLHSSGMFASSRRVGVPLTSSR